ncbi:NHLP-related RiPP peptide [Duganella sp. LjRoot269]|jgi:putative modified peptide|uniref:NHLP-related RiPP peptide n=1 Tax=Duganella sp. LjRoot269 TaxID=3342305 RepID=UPI003ECC4416
MTKHTSGELSTVLDKLAKDDAFRDHMLRDPVGALGGLGISLDPAQVPAVRSLPSKDSIVADQTAMHSNIVSEGTMVVFLLSGGAAA